MTAQEKTSNLVFQVYFSTGLNKFFSNFEMTKQTGCMQRTLTILNKHTTSTYFEQQFIVYHKANSHTVVS